MNRFTEDKLYVASQSFEDFEQQGIFAIPYGYALHFNPTTASAQLVERDAHKTFPGVGGYYFEREGDR